MVSIIALDNIKSHLGRLELEYEGVKIWVTITIDPVSWPDPTFPFTHTHLHYKDGQGI
jgi:hypothetical protein